MSRFLVLLATVTLALGSVNHAALAQTPEVPAPTTPRPADAATRASYDRADALSRSVFWGQEYQINALDPVAGVKLAQALRELGQYDQAAQTAEGLLTVQPGNLDAMLEVGRAHIARGHAFYGISALEKARDLAPRDWRPLSLLGVAYQQVRRADDAQAAWAAALSLSPENPDVLTNAAIAHMAGGNVVEAESLLRRAAAQPGASLRVRQNLALALGLRGNLAEAEQILRRDQPPEVADANLKWLSERMGATTATAPAPTATPTSAPTPTARLWPGG